MECMIYNATFDLSNNYQIRLTIMYYQFGKVKLNFVYTSRKTLKKLGDRQRQKKLFIFVEILSVS